MEPYTKRLLDSQIERLLSELPALNINGARGVGKTTTALQHARTVLRLDIEADRQRLQAQPDLLTSSPRSPASPPMPEPILIDEWQRYPPVLDLLKVAIDTDTRPGRFILTGSASPANPETSTSASRIVSLQMRTMSLVERGTEQPSVSLADLLSGERPDIGGETDVGLTDYVDEIFTSGFPALRRLNQEARSLALGSYCDTIIDLDFPAAGTQTRDTSALRAWLEAFATVVATMTTLKSIREAAAQGKGSPSAFETARSYARTLERIWVSDPVDSWLPTKNRLKRVAKSPKHFLVDPALAARLEGISAPDLLLGPEGDHMVLGDGKYLGQLFESLVALNLKVYAQTTDIEARLHHFRDSNGRREIDFVLVKPGGKVLALEVKLTQSASDGDGKNLRWFAEQLGDDLLDAVVITTGRHAFRRPDGIAVIPAALLGP